MIKISRVLYYFISQHNINLLTTELSVSIQEPLSLRMTGGDIMRSCLTGGPPSQTTLWVHPIRRAGCVVPRLSWGLASEPWCRCTLLSLSCASPLHGLGSLSCPGRHGVGVSLWGEGVGTLQMWMSWGSRVLLPWLSSTLLSLICMYARYRCFSCRVFRLNSLQHKEMTTIYYT